MSARPSGARWTVTVALVAVGCGGAGPLLHPAHVEPEGVVTAGAGVAGQLVAGDAGTKIQAARETTVRGLAPTIDADAKYRAGALAIAALGPGVTPFVGARVGVGWESEAGLTYTGRTLRIDARHAFGDEAWAFSVGLGGHAKHGRPRSGPSADLLGLGVEGVSGGGFDVPLVGGWRSAAGLLQVWGGGRFFYERLGGAICLRCDVPGAQSMAFRGTRFSGGGLLGVALGFRHVFVALEFDAAYEAGSASFEGGGDASMSGFTLAPAGAVIGRF